MRGEAEKSRNLPDLAIKSREWQDSHPQPLGEESMRQKTIGVTVETGHQPSWTMVDIGTTLELDGATVIVDITDDQRKFVRVITPLTKAA